MLVPGIRSQESRTIGDKGSVDILWWKITIRIKINVHRRHMRVNQCGRGLHAFHQESISLRQGQNTVVVTDREIDPNLVTVGKWPPIKSAIADDVNPGGDPYNSTGQHVIIKPKLDLED